MPKGKEEDQRVTRIPGVKPGYVVNEKGNHRLCLFGPKWSWSRICVCASATFWVYKQGTGEYSKCKNMASIQIKSVSACCIFKRKKILYKTTYKIFFLVACKLVAQCVSLSHHLRSSKSLKQAESRIQRPTCCAIGDTMDSTKVALANRTGESDVFPTSGMCWCNKLQTFPNKCLKFPMCSGLSWG